MIRTQIQLTEEQARRVRAIGREKNLSMAEVIRRFIDRGLEEERPTRAEQYDRARQLVGRFEDREGATDLAEAHDAYLDPAFE